MTNPKNLCGACGVDFTTVRAFDRHRVGVHAYTYSEGVKMEPMREDGRRCLRREEFEGADLELDRFGRWRIRRTQKQIDALSSLQQSKLAGDGSDDSITE